MKEKENRIGTLHNMVQKLFKTDNSFKMIVYGSREIEIRTPFKNFIIPFGDSGKERYKEVLEVLGKKVKGGSKT
jgi:hypothetical protein